MQQQNTSSESTVTIVSCGRNCVKHIDQWCESIINQQNQNWRCIAVLDPSDDGSDVKLMHVTKKDTRFYPILNLRTRKGRLQNIHDAVWPLSDDDIVMLVDMDDWLLCQEVIDRVLQEYNKQCSDVWMTYGSYIDTDCNHGVWCRSIPDHVWSDNSHRYHRWSTSHLITFKRGLFGEIKFRDMMDDNGEWFMRATDRAMVWPMLELAGKDRVSYIEDALYGLRVHGNEENEDEVIACLQRREPYKTLEGCPWRR